MAFARVTNLPKIANTASTSRPNPRRSCRLPSGHPEGYFEAFANVYRSAYDNMALRADGQDFEKVNTVYPNISDGVEGMYFIQQCVASSKDGGAWLPLRHELARR